MSYDYSQLSWKSVRDMMRKWREDNERRSENVIQLWEAVLEDHVHKTGNERHLILEQVIMAALDTAQFDIATKCIKVLSTDFPGSMRIMKLKAMRLEALERYDEAVDVLDAIISRDGTNAAPRKRKVAILKARGLRSEAIKELIDYLKRFMSDQEAWHELCNLYLEESDYSKAVFCMEEVLLYNPHSHLIHQKIGDIKYTAGGMENIEIARIYYSQAIKLNPNNLRALYGLYLCCSYIANSKALGSKRKDAQKMAQWALEQAKMRTSNLSQIDENEKLISSLENTFGNLEIRSN